MIIISAWMSGFSESSNELHCVCVWKVPVEIRTWLWTHCWTYSDVTAEQKRSRWSQMRADDRRWWRSIHVNILFAFLFEFPLGFGLGLKINPVCLRNPGIPITFYQRRSFSTYLSQDKARMSGGNELCSSSNIQSFLWIIRFHSCQPRAGIWMVEDWDYVFSCPVWASPCLL